MSRLNKAMDYLTDTYGFSPCLDNFNGIDMDMVSSQECLKMPDCEGCPAYSEVLVPVQTEKLNVTPADNN
ncbi:hypothetical protein VPHD292_0076 [Vibrio phage D292]